MNRAERRAGMPQKQFDEHSCMVLTRFKELDHHVKAADCLECDGSTDVAPENCPSCNDGVVPATDYFGYVCPSAGCGRKWVQMQFVLKGQRHVSWRSLDDLRVGSDRENAYPFSVRRTKR